MDKSKRGVASLNKFYCARGVKFDLSKAQCPHLRHLDPYVPGRQMNEPGWMKLNTNENPYPPSPKVAEVLSGLVERLPKYPDPSAGVFCRAVARLHQIPAEWVVAGNGSDELLGLLARSFTGPGRPLGAMVPSYSLYPVLAGIQNAPFLEVPYGDSFDLDPEAIERCGAPAFFLTSPNAPSGTGYGNALIRRLAERFDGLLVVDEAYADFAEESAISLVGDFPNLCVTRSLSKSYGLAGLRLGYLVGHPDLIRIIHSVRDAYNVDLFAQEIGAAVLGDRDYFASTRGKILRSREALSDGLETLGWHVYPSAANFVLAEPRREDGSAGPEVARDCFFWLESHKILVRYFDNHALTRSRLRISVGSEDQVKQLLSAIKQWQQNEPVN